MDKVKQYREIVTRTLMEYAQYKPSHGDVTPELVIDRERDHYELMHVGWDAQRRVHGSVVHLDIINGKIWVQYDGTSRPVVDELLAAGIPSEDIVLAFHPAEVRQHTGFAVG